MSTITFTITIKDIEALQATQPTYEATSHTGEKRQAPYLLTDNDEPFDLLCKYSNVWTYNEWEENNYEYTDENLDHAIENLKFKKAFLSTLTNEARMNYANDIHLFNTDLQSFTNEYIELYKQNRQSDNTILQEEFSKEELSFYESQYKEYLNGVRSNPGALQEVKDYMNIESLDLNRET